MANTPAAVSSEVVKGPPDRAGRARRELLHGLSAVTLALLAAACGGSGDSAGPAPERTRTSVTLESDVGDYIGGGRTLRYTLADAQISLNPVGGTLTVAVTGDERWNGTLALPAGATQLAPGTYALLTRYPFHDAATGGFDWSGEGRGCNTSNTTVVIDRATYASGLLVGLDLTFEQHCEGAAPALHGRIVYAADDDTTPPGPVSPPPAGLWAPPAGAVPATGGFAYLERSGGYGAGTSLATLADAVFTVSASGNGLAVRVVGDAFYDFTFQAMSGLPSVAPGYYPGLGPYPFHNPVRGGLSAGGCGEGAWVAVDEVLYSGNQLLSFDLRFEDRCGSSGVRGRIRWSAAEIPPAAGPTVPPPGLWSPAPGAVPASGNVVLLESSTGDYVGQGATYAYTQADAILGVVATGGTLAVEVTGDQRWRGDFRTMAGLSAFAAGYYGDATRAPFHNPRRGGLEWSGEGRGCNTLTGWFVVDEVHYEAGALAAITLRFQQHCEGSSAVLHGLVRWAAGDTTAPPGPVNPPPADLWAPDAADLPATGSYVHLASDPGDYIGAGLKQTFTKADAVLVVAASGAGLRVDVTGDTWWFGDFQPMSWLSRLEPGLYPDLRRYPFHNPIRGGLAWSGDGRGCNTLTGWFVVDAVAYSGANLASIDVRFEQHCEGGGPALHGAIHWRADDPTVPPGPVVPPPAGLWAPAAGATPASGNYAYLVSDPGDYIGQGVTRTLAPPGWTLGVSASGSHVSVSASGSTWWNGNFAGMSTIARLEPGYYPNLVRYPFNNPVRGGLDWSGDGRGCNTLTGWFVVDAVAYSGANLASIDLRFEQHCEGGAPALHGAIHWTSP